MGALAHVDRLGCTKPDSYAYSTAYTRLRTSNFCRMRVIPAGLAYGIFTKLDVNDRSAAARRGHELDLL